MRNTNRIWRGEMPEVSDSEEREMMELLIDMNGRVSSALSELQYHQNHSNDLWEVMDQLEEAESKLDSIKEILH